MDWIAPIPYHPPLSANIPPGSQKCINVVEQVLMAVVAIGYASAHGGHGRGYRHVLFIMG